ncbi:tRNA synthetases class II (A)-domain-containing protein [Haematococcus lacustris]
MAPCKLYGAGAQTFKVELVAAFAGVQLETPPFTPGITDKTPWFLKLSPGGSTPLLVTPEGQGLTGAHAIARFLAASGPQAAQLYPEAVQPLDLRRVQVEQWLDWVLGLEAALAQVVCPLLGLQPEQYPVEGAQSRAAQSRLAGLLAEVEAHLAAQAAPYLTGAAPSLADVVLAASLLHWWVMLADGPAREQSPRLAALLAAVYAEPAASPALKGVALKPAAQAVVHCPEGPNPWGQGPSPLEVLTPLLAQPWSGARTRAAFNEFFETKAHTYWASSAVVPHNDPTLLFTNAGMNQFKPIFLGQVDPASAMGRLKRACNSQKCIRAGGKHNDLDDVGKDVYHHTFFEMLGNWSFGDYFKEEAISWAWELLTKVYQLPPERLYATYFQGDPGAGIPADEEAKAIWLRFLPPGHVLPFGNKENFWEMGDQGPCGPCTEIHFDRIGGRDASHLVNLDDPNVLEIWNNVFIQFNREADGSLRSLPAKHVDTGMGLERITSVLQGKMSNYATDLFTPIFDEIQRLTGARSYTDKIGADDSDGVDMAYRVVADHIRTLSFSIADGARPGNEGRDYVLRRILRRAVRYGRDVLGAKEGFFAQLVDVVVRNFSGFFPELLAARDVIHSVIAEEETSFSRTLLKGIERFKKLAAALQAKGDKLVSGAEAFELWDTYGFPVDLTQLMAEEKGLSVDAAGFKQALEEARERSKTAGKKAAGEGLKFQAEATGWLQKASIPLTDDSPKYEPQRLTTQVLAIMTPAGFVQSSEESGDSLVGLVLAATPLYAEQGGQVSDTGRVTGPSGSVSVREAQVAAGYVLHVGELTGSLRVGEEVTVEIDSGRRAQVMPNHTFTHVLNYALREKLGDHVEQKGSVVLPDKLRFDFSNNGPVDADKLRAIEVICQQQLEADLKVYSKEVALAQARDIYGLRAVFGEAYPDPVRVVSIGKPVEQLLEEPSNPDNRSYSVEFCGGTHLASLKQATAFALISEEGIAKGIRRIVGVTGSEAQAALQEGQRLVQAVKEAAALSDTAQLEATISQLKQTLDAAVMSSGLKASLRDELASLGKKVAEANKAVAAANKARAASQALTAADSAVAAGKSYVVVKLDIGGDAKAATEAWIAITAKHAGLAAFITSADVDKGKVVVYAGVPKALQSKLTAIAWVTPVLSIVGGKGGGKADVAQCQGTAVDKVDEAMAAAEAAAGAALA